MKKAVQTDGRTNDANVNIESSELRSEILESDKDFTVLYNLSLFDSTNVNGCFYEFS